jgi:hypothetical protein
MNRFFVILLPIIWAATATISFLHPGDEYRFFVLSSIAGSWVCFLLPNSGHLSDVLWLILLTGFVVLGFLGFLMDKLNMSQRLWLVTFATCSFVILVWILTKYSSLHRAIQANGSITAYVVGASNIGLYLSVILMFSIKVFTTIVFRIRLKGAERDQP